MSLSGTFFVIPSFQSQKRSCLHDKFYDLGHKLFSFAPGVMGYQALTYYTRTDAQGAQTYGNLQVFDGNDNPTNWPSDLIAPNPAVLLSK